MNLFLLRHGLAVEQTIPGFKLDSDRPLTPEGRKKISRLAAVLGRLEISFDLILTSPYLRAAQTAEIVAETLGVSQKLEMSKHLVPGSTAKPLFEELNRRRRHLNEVLLVGHEPDLSRLISILVTGKLGLPLELKKGGLCKLEAAALGYRRCATLQWLLAPKLCAPLG
jgi:phosphohistidine phosphatase